MPHIQGDFPEPEGADPDIWRYMNLAKLLSILDKEALYFRRLADLSDRFEGTLSEPTAEALREEVRGVSGEDLPDALITLPEATRQTSYVNCWHSNSVESMAMWNQYSKMPLAVKSTHDRFSESLGSVVEELRDFNYPEINSDQETPIHISPVQYSDFSTDFMDSVQEDIKFATLFKREPFKHENEIRAVICGNPFKILEEDEAPSPTLHISLEGDPDSLDSGENPQKRFPLTEPNIRRLGIGIDSGLYVDIDTEKLIEEIVLEPDAPKYIFETVQSVVEEMGFPEEKVRRSNLERDPVSPDTPWTE